MSEQTIGRYEVKREVGRGGMSTVLHAYDPRFKRDVAIKVLPREFLHDPLFRARFEREAETIAALEHPAIVPVYDFGEDDGQLYLVMRYMGGSSLQERIEKGPLSISRTLEILTRLAPALDKAHSLGVIHRDLKSANILFDEDDNAFLSDFGIAKLAETSMGLTGTGSMIGTPAYMSPEQARGDPTVDGRSDLYSLGVIMFEMLTGELPFESDTPMGIAIKHITDPVPRILHFQPDLPPGCEAVLMRVMNKDQNLRYATADEMVRDLQLAVQGDVGLYATMSGASVKPPDTKELPAVSGSVASVAGAIPLWGWIAGGVVLIGLIGWLGLSGSQIRGATPVSDKTQTAAATATTIAVPTGTPGVTLAPTVELATLTPRPLGPAFGGGSGYFVFVSGKDTLGKIFVANIECMNSDGLCDSGLTQLSRDSANNRWPSFSPDGKMIVYRSTTSGNPDIYIMNSDGSNIKQLTRVEARDDMPSFSPDGKKIVFVSERDGGKPELYVMNPDGTQQERLTDDAFEDASPAWSPDGKKILFTSLRDNNRDLYLLSADCVQAPDNCSSGQVRLTTDPASDYQGAWSPDGGRIVFVTERDGNPEIYVMSATGADKTRLTDGSSAEQAPSWSPDGQYILFGSRRTMDTNPNGTFQIFIMKPDGKDVRQVSGILEDTNVDASMQPFVAP